MRERGKEEESKELMKKKSNKIKSEENKGEKDGLTAITDETTPKPVPKPTPKQLEEERETSVKSRVQQFTHKFSIPPIPPKETNRPPPLNRNQCEREPTALLQKRRRPRDNEVGDQDISCWEGKKPTEGNCKETRDWWENQGGE